MKFIVMNLLKVFKNLFLGFALFSLFVTVALVIYIIFPKYMSSIVLPLLALVYCFVPVHYIKTDWNALTILGFWILNSLAVFFLVPQLYAFYIYSTHPAQYYETIQSIKSQDRDELWALKFLKPLTVKLDAMECDHYKNDRYKSSISRSSYCVVPVFLENQKQKEIFLVAVDEHMKEGDGSRRHYQDRENARRKKWSQTDFYEAFIVNKNHTHQGRYGKAFQTMLQKHQLQADQDVVFVDLVKSVKVGLREKGDELFLKLMIGFFVWLSLILLNLFFKKEKKFA